MTNTVCPAKELFEEFVMVCGIDTLHLNKKWMSSLCEGAALLQKIDNIHELQLLKKELIQELLLQAEIFLKTNCKDCRVNFSK